MVSVTPTTYKAMPVQEAMAKVFGDEWLDRYYGSKIVRKPAEQAHREPLGTCELCDFESGYKVLTVEGERITVCKSCWEAVTIVTVPHRPHPHRDLSNILSFTNSETFWNIITFILVISPIVLMVLLG